MIKTKQFLILGDFNIHVLECTNWLRDVLNSFGLERYFNTLTRVTYSTSTSIDNVITNIQAALVTVLDAAVWDHFAQEVVISGYCSELQSPFKKIQRNLHHKNNKLLNQNL